MYDCCGVPQESNPNEENYWPGVSKLKYFQQFTPKPRKRMLRQMFASQKSQHAVNLLDKLLTLNPAQRFSAEQALDHEYFFEEPLPIEPHQSVKHYSCGCALRALACSSGLILSVLRCSDILNSLATITSMAANRSAKRKRRIKAGRSNSNSSSNTWAAAAAVIRPLRLLRLTRPPFPTRTAIST